MVGSELIKIGVNLSNTCAKIFLSRMYEIRKDGQEIYRGDSNSPHTSVKSPVYD